MALSSTAAMSVVLVAIGSTTVASLWPWRSEGEHAAVQAELPAAVWRCSHATPVAIAAQGSADGARSPGEPSFNCPLNHPPAIQSVSADAMFRALAR